MKQSANNEVFARNLERYIQRSGKTKKELAEIVGVAPSTFNEWTKGKKYPRMDKVEKLANYFGILKSDLIEDKEKPTEQSDGLSDNQRVLMEFAKSLSEDQAAIALRVLKSLVEAD